MVSTASSGTFLPHYTRVGLCAQCYGRNDGSLPLKFGYKRSWPRREKVKAVSRGEVYLFYIKGKSGHIVER